MAQIAIDRFELERRYEHVQKQALSTPVYITTEGKETHVLVSIERFKEMKVAALKSALLD